MKQAEPGASRKMRSPVAMTLAMAMLLASLGTSIANIALPALSAAFSAPFAQVQTVVVAYLAGLTVTVLVAGRLGDAYGLKPMLIVGLAVFSTASLLCAIAPNLWLLVGARALQGIGAAFLMTLTMAMMRQTAGEAKVGRAMGLLGTASALGTALGPSLGGLLIPMTGWRGIFWIQVPLAVPALVLAVVTLPGEQPRAKAPSLRLWPKISSHLAANLALNVMVAAVMMATLVVGPFYLSLGLGLEAMDVGLVMAVGPVISIFSGIPGGRLVDGWGSGRVLTIGLVMLTAGALLLAFLPDTIGVVGYLLAITVLTPGYQLFQAANNTATLAHVARDQRGMASGALNLSRNIGLIAGASLMGAVFAFGAGSGQFTGATALDIAAGMRLTFLLAGGMMLTALGIVFGRLAPSHRPL